MKFTQSDVSTLTDADVKRLALIADRAAAAGGPFGPFWRTFSAAAVEAVRERRRVLAHLEQDAMDDEDAGRLGSIVAPGSQAVADAAAELRASVRRSGDTFPRDTP